MSGICGLFNLDDAPVADRDVLAMCALLERRGPDGFAIRNDGVAGLGHTALASTLGSQRESQPFAHQESGCCISADIRLDNRDELLTAVGSVGSPEVIGDAELALLAYLKWGEACVDRLLGDFAFAIWDGRHQHLFCARDHFGMRPFYYHYQPGQRFVFGSSAKLLTVLPSVPFAVNEQRIADYLVPELEWADYTSTFFKEIYRLPPGHCAVVAKTALRISEYWQPGSQPHSANLSDDDYREGFLDVFTKSIDARLRTPEGPAGSMLSGGMDSGSIVAISKELLASRGDGPLPTFSAVSGNYNPDESIECADSRAIYASIALPGVDPTLIAPEAISDQVEFMLADYEEPFDADFMFLKAIYQSASDRGLNVLLDGGGGDIVLSEGSYIARLVKAGRWSQAYAEIAGENRFHDGNRRSLLSALLHYLRAGMTPDFVRRSLQSGVHRRRDRAMLEESLISRDFAKSTDVAARFAVYRESFAAARHPDYAVERIRAIRPNVTAGRERYARIAALLGMEARDPFLDKRLVEYVSGLPGHLRMRDGMDKIVLRDLMSDQVPHEVAWQGRKPHVGWQFNRLVTRQLVQTGALTPDVLSADIDEYVDKDDLDLAWESMRKSGFNESLNRAIYLSFWLKENSQRPVVPDKKIL